MDFSKLKVIVIDDSSFARAMNSTQLKRLGVEKVDMPEDAAEGWDMITQALLNDEPYDLIITDINMPEIDGFDLMDRIKSDPMSESLKVIVISADADTFMQDAAKASGALAYLVKPVSSKVLEEALVKIFG